MIQQCDFLLYPLAGALEQLCLLVFMLELVGCPWLISSEISGLLPKQQLLVKVKFQCNAAPARLTCKSPHVQSPVQPLCYLLHNPVSSTVPHAIPLQSLCNPSGQSSFQCNLSCNLFCRQCTRQQLRAWGKVRWWVLGGTPSTAPTSLTAWSALSRTLR